VASSVHGTPRHARLFFLPLWQHPPTVKGASLDRIQLKGKAVANLYNLLNPDLLAEEITENRKRALPDFRTIMAL